MPLHAPTTGDPIPASDVDQFVTLLQSGAAGTVLTGQGVGSDPAFSPNIDIPGTLNVTGVAEFGASVQLDDTLRLSVEVLTYASVVSVPASFDGVVETTTTSSVGNATLNADVAGADGQLLYVMVHNDATAARTITFGTHFVAVGPLIGTPGQTAIVAFLSNGSAFYEVGRSVQSAGGAGTVTSVALSTPGVLYSVSGSPITSSGTLALALINQSANQVLAGPTTGSAAAPGFRALVDADIPNVMTSADDLIIGGASGARTRLAKGTDGQVLTVDPTTHHLVWATPASGSGTVTSVSGTAPVSVATGTTTPVISVAVAVASGASHAAGLVPDPGSTAGTTKFLREDMTFAAPPGGGSLTTASAQLSADVTMTSANTYYDGPSVSLAAGTWLLVCAITLVNNSVANYTAKLWDGTTVGSSVGGTQAVSGGGYVEASLSALVSPTGTTTYKVSAAFTGVSGAKILAAAANNSAGNNASTLIAVKVA